MYSGIINRLSLYAIFLLIKPNIWFPFLAAIPHCSDTFMSGVTFHIEACCLQPDHNLDMHLHWPLLVKGSADSLLIHVIANSNGVFCVFFTESCRTKVPKPYSKESMSIGTFLDISQSDRPRTRSVKTKNKRCRQTERERHVHKENYSIDVCNAQRVADHALEVCRFSVLHAFKCSIVV